MNKTRRMSKVLVTDDDALQQLILRKYLEGNGYEVLEACNGSEALKVLSDDPDIRMLITDLVMPRMDGYELIQAVRERQMRYVYIIVLTGMDDKDALVKALSLGADDFLIKPVFPDELKLRILGGSRLLNLEGHEEIIFSMVRLCEFRSDETGYHLERIQEYTRLLARHLSNYYPTTGLTLSMADEIARVSPLHDVGKVAIPDHILHKPGKLTIEEWAIMKTHASIGGRLIKDIYDKVVSPYLWFAYEIAMFHHEKWDGTGYPEGLREENIPLPARIVALADVYDALTSKRCYKPVFSHEQSKEIIIKAKGQHFDPMLVETFLALEDAFVETGKKFRDAPLN